MNRNYLKYILIGGVSIFVWTGCDDYLNRESTSGVNTPDLIWQIRKQSQPFWRICMTRG